MHSTYCPSFASILLVATVALPATLGAAQSLPAAPAARVTSEAATLAETRDLLAHNQLPAAEAQLRTAIAAAPNDPDFHYLLALVLLRLNRPTDSLAESTTAARFRSPTATELLVVASDYILLKAYPQAEHWLRYALTLTPADAHLWYLLGRAQYSQDHAADAATSFLQCLRLASPGAAATIKEAVRAEYNLGLAEEQLQHPNEARAAYNRAIAAQADQPIKDPQPYLDLGILDLAQQRPADALPLLEQATRLAPHNALAFEKLGLTLDALHRPADATAALEAAITLAPNAERPHFFLGRIERRRGHNDAAAIQFHLAQELLGTHSDTATPKPRSIALSRVTSPEPRHQP